MARALAEQKELKVKTTTISVQTGDEYEFYLSISKNKNIRLYKCDKYKDYVLSINFGNCKKYIITREMWVKFRRHIHRIDYVLHVKSQPPNKQ